MSNVKPICSECGAENVCLDEVISVWSAKDQEWITTNESIDVDCINCDHKGEPVWVDIDTPPTTSDDKLSDVRLLAMICDEYNEILRNNADTRDNEPEEIDRLFEKCRDALASTFQHQAREDDLYIAVDLAIEELNDKLGYDDIYTDDDKEEIRQRIERLSTYINPTK